MRLYLIPVMGLCFAVDGLLLVAAARLAGQGIRPGNFALAAALGALYGGACLLPEFVFLGKTLWRLASLAFVGIVAFGASDLRCTALYMVLNMAAGGLALALGGEKTMLSAAAVVCLLCLLGLWGRPGRCVPVVLRWDGRQEQVLALRDTGNTLRDPVTGERVLVVGPEVARRLVGLTKQQLAAPVETLEKRTLPGLRLIPYAAVGSQGLLLALRLTDVQIDGRRGGMVVAFAPTGLDGKEGFQALTGGFA